MIAAIVLAGGASRRLGRPKQLVAYRGQPLVRRIAIEARAACDRVIVVLGANEAQIRPVLEGLAIAIVSNAEWDEGIASSIRAGVTEARAIGAGAAILLTCDQPALDARTLDRLIAAYRSGAPIVASRYSGAIGVPALFDARAFASLLALRGDVGAKRVLREADAAVVDWPEGAIDVDTEDDARRIESTAPNEPNEKRQ